jgi:excisionase family DNA binding protein
MLSESMMTVHEVSAVLKVSEETVRSWIHAKDLRAIKFGREWRVAVRDLESFLNARANRPMEG